MYGIILLISPRIFQVGKRQSTVLVDIRNTNVFYKFWILLMVILITFLTLLATKQGIICSRPLFLDKTVNVCRCWGLIEDLIFSVTLMCVLRYSRNNCNFSGLKHQHNHLLVVGKIHDTFM